MRTIFARLVGIAVISGCTPAGDSSASVEVSDTHWSVSFDPQVSIGVVDGPADPPGVITPAPVPSRMPTSPEPWPRRSRTHS